MCQHLGRILLLGLYIPIVKLLTSKSAKRYFVYGSTEFINTFLSLRDIRSWWTMIVAVVCQFGVGVKLLLAAVTVILLCPGKCLFSRWPKDPIFTGWHFPTESALILSLSCIPRYTHHILVKVSHKLLPSVAFSSTSLANKIFNPQYSQHNISIVWIAWHADSYQKSSLPKLPNERGGTSRGEYSSC